MKKKLQLQDIKINSFVTAMDKDALLGGAIDMSSGGATKCVEVFEGCTKQHCTGRDCNDGEAFANIGLASGHPVHC